MTNKLPLVSIIIPCRNEEKFISKCLDSIIAQDYPKDRIEVLVVDGKSNDKTRNVLKDYTDKYSFIKTLDNPKKVTPVAMNVGIKVARGDYILILSSHSKIDQTIVYHIFVIRLRKRKICLNPNISQKRRHNK